jgi:hypothetical protein
MFDTFLHNFNQSKWRSIVRIILRYQDGQRIEAVLLAANREQMRVAIDSADDTATFIRSYDCWHGENGEVVEIEALIALEGTEVSPLPAGEAKRAFSAGGTTNF